MAGDFLRQPESLQRSRGLAVAVKLDRQPACIDRLALWLSKGSTIDGLWVGSFEGKPHSALRRVEEALQLIKRYDRLGYTRITRDLDRIWVTLLPSAQAHYDRSMNACVVDERYILGDTTTLEQIASTFIHEATHARLEGWGISYVEAMRIRIEAICLRQELRFLGKLPNTEVLRDEIARTLEWCAADHDGYFADASFRTREEDGQIKTLRHLNAPDWIIRWMTWLISRRRKRASVSLGS
ncbi:hypothetical protein [Bradyrhizobium sp. BR 10289]|uniref:hypothetical protein n=1 Tax=Bradyrhizobium sp. BR 10289 TaxID=2749993 RepID=UPI001C646E85|nr:hypothetical protein [Bradyrhizobium sp. BR 10289]MBW7970620.1 hypothetical protein [Bradyrhizobium sp. BR 10289]